MTLKAAEARVKRRKMTEVTEHQSALVRREQLAAEWWSCEGQHMAICEEAVKNAFLAGMDAARKQQA